MSIVTKAVQGGVQVISVPSGTAKLHVAYNTLRSGGGTIYDPEGKPRTYVAQSQPTIPPWDSQYPWIDVQALASNGSTISGWAGRKEPLLVLPPPKPSPSPTPALVVACDVSAWSRSSGLLAELGAGGIKWIRCNANQAAEVSGTGTAVAVQILGHVSDSPTTIQTTIRHFAEAHPEVKRIELGNEFYLNGGHVSDYKAQLAAARQGITESGHRPLLIADWGQNHGWGAALKKLGGLQYIDEAACHAYGGDAGQHGGLAGAWDLIAKTHEESELPVPVTEGGWPTGRTHYNVTAPTGDSQQWTEEQQATAITAFAARARQEKYVPVFVNFNGVDYGSNDFYGIERVDRSHKPSFAALAAAG